MWCEIQRHPAKQGFETNPSLSLSQAHPMLEYELLSPKQVCDLHPWHSLEYGHHIHHQERESQ